MPLNVERKLYSATLLVRLAISKEAVTRSCFSEWNRLSVPMPRLKTLCPFAVEAVTLPALLALKELLAAAGVPRNDSRCHGAPTNQHGGHRSNPKHGRSPVYAEVSL